MFQSTHSLRSATFLAACCCTSKKRFNPRTPCGVRPMIISMNPYDNWFQSTHSLRSATCCRDAPHGQVDVSIHALLAECDRNAVIIRSVMLGFNPRTPCGVRPAVGKIVLFSSLFQSTHSLRSATNARRAGICTRKVSIHALLAECDPRRKLKRLSKSAFQSTHSLRSATGSRPCCGAG